MSTKTPEHHDNNDEFLTARELRVLTALIRQEQSSLAEDIARSDVAARVLAEKRTEELDRILRKLRKIAETASKALDTVWVYREPDTGWSWRRVASTGLELATSTQSSASKAWCWYYAATVNGGHFVIKEQKKEGGDEE